MPETASSINLYFDNQPAAADRLALFRQVRIDQAIGMAAEAELEMEIGVDASGNWTGVEEDFVQPFKRVRVEVRIRQNDPVALIDGPIVGQRFEMSAAPNQSKMVLIVQDDSVLLNQEEQVAIFEDQSADQIASGLFQQAGLTAETDSVPAASGGLTRYTVQRGTAMQLVRELARQNGLFAYVRPGDTPGSSVGVFKRPDLADAGYPVLIPVGERRNMDRFSAEFDGLRPLQARADNVDLTNQELLSSSAEASDLNTQGDMAAHQMVSAGKALLARTGAATVELDAATQSAVNLSSWAYSASGEVVADSYSGVLRPYKTVAVSGAGGYLSGQWLITKVEHVINESGYRQHFNLRRNARAGGSGGGGGIPGGIF